jgi:hypothetical protein
MNRDKVKQLVAEAKRIARQADSWITLCNALTDPVGGLIARHFPDADEREAFLCSSEYEQLNNLVRRTIEQKGLYPRRAGSKRASAP